MTASPGTALHVAGVSVAYGRRIAIRELTLPPLRAGSVTAVVGPNGAGKSTLLRVLAGLTPAAGRVRLGDWDLLNASASAHSARVAFMPQAVPQGVGLSVFEAVLSAMHAGSTAERPLPSGAMQERAAAILDRVGVLPHAHRNLQQLSGGERQLASLAQALVREPAVLLLDEPTSALDLRHQVSVMRLVRELADEGRLVLTVLHDLNLAMRWADRVVVLNAGQLDATGPPADALTAEVLARTYGVEARIERCTRGRPQILIDGLADVVARGGA